MKKIILSCLVALVLFSIPFTSFAVPQVKVEVLFMSHGPLEETLKQIKGVFSGYGNKLTVNWYDFESKVGERFMTQKGVREHIPLVIWIDGKFAFPLDGREIKFVGFPTGSGPAFFQGKWTIDDLRKALDQIIGSK